MVNCRGYLSFLTVLLVFVFSDRASSYSVRAALPYECPEPESIFPCYCEDEDDDPSVFCNHLTKPEQIYQGVKGLSGIRIYKLTFFRNWILDPVKSDAFKGVAAERVLFENSTITLTAPQFQGLENHLSTIQLRGCFNKTNPLVPLSLDHLSKLRELIFEKNKITNLPDDWIKSVPDSLRTVTVEENTIVSMGDEAFSKIKHLTFLVLEGNRLVIIKRSMFPNPASDLRSLNLNSNRIKYLPTDIFSDMPNLRNLEIANNRLTALDENIWSGVLTQLTKMDVLGNPLVCDRNLRWMYSDRRRPVLLEGRCAEPEELRNKSLFMLKKQDLN